MSSAKKTAANSLVALSSAAVIAVYAAGYARTAPAAGQLIATATTTNGTVPPASPLAPAAPTATSTAATGPGNPPAGFDQGQGGQRGGRQAPNGSARGGVAAPPPITTTATVTDTSPAPAAVAGTFRDGTYNGTGTSRHGNITVTVTVQGGTIASAEVTDCATRYPCTLIAELPGQVLARQSAAVDAVTGATDSTNAYRAAVNAALAQAR